MVNAVDRVAYTARQAARVAWFMGHYFAAREFHGAAPKNGRDRPRPARPGPSRERMVADMAALFAQDLANAEAGLYPLPADRDGSLPELVRRSRLFFADLPQSTERKQNGRGREVHSEDLAARYPSYYLQNFHYQSGGYLTDDSARLYDMQVEVLFSGTANAMRRACLVPLAETMRGRDQRTVRLLDVACGTGRFLRFAKRAYPRLAASGVDLSAAYLGEARRHLRPYGDVALNVAKAEDLPVADASQDVVVSVYLFHEIPPEVRRQAVREFARVLKPGGRLIFMDSLQLGDVPDYDGLLERFPVNFHEPFFASYIAEDLRSLFVDAGLSVAREEPVFLSKLVVCDKPV